ncbi:hypothetical protein AB0J55_04465 [Amycolatopsis sp. NPDC049688]|uniref:hypothetical protein n=1 Tax=Amycolatopsis sp. NPDC049688 TaxID=3154733 RepID=UPI00341BAF06
MSKLSTEGEPSGVSDGRLLLKWKTVGIVGSLSGIGCLGVLITVVSIKDIDTLSTVALVLAILAFAIQIMIFIAQTSAATEQSRSTLEINSETKSILSELRTRTQATNDVLNLQFNKLLDKMLFVTQESEQNASDDAANSSGEGFEVYLQEMRSALIELKKDVNNSSRARFRSDEEVYDVSAEERAYRRRLLDVRQWPNRKLEEDLRAGGLADLTEEGAGLLDQYASAYLRDGARVKVHFVLDPNSGAVAELLKADVISLLTSGAKGGVYGLTRKGQFAVRLVIADPPPHAFKKFPWLRYLRPTLFEFSDMSNVPGGGDGKTTG